MLVYSQTDLVSLKDTNKLYRHYPLTKSHETTVTGPSLSINSLNSIPLPDGSNGGL